MNNTDEKLKEYFKEHIEDLMKYLIELYEFQENIKFINTEIAYLDEKDKLD